MTYQPIEIEGQVIEVEEHSTEMEEHRGPVFEPSIEMGDTFTQTASSFFEETFSFHEVKASSITSDDSMVETNVQAFEEEESITSMAVRVISVEEPSIQMIGPLSS